MEGMNLLTDRFASMTGSFEKQYNLSVYPKGIYFFRVISDKSVIVRKVILQ
jgi:hypothetical protein